ncbi:MAG: hypothetical protein J6T35_01885 [Bacteroidales bacterium]|nr:hypothetical protein [Bacteroidales bacterium]
MENKSKSTSLVAWTDKGRVFMVPYLLDEMCGQYLEEIKHCSYRTGKEPYWKSEIDRLLETSGKWEVYGDFLLGAGRIWDAYQCFERAALECLCCSDGLWCDTETSQRPMSALLYRFYAMYKRCRQLVRQYPYLRLKFRGSWLEEKYEDFTSESNQAWKELVEYDRVWNFGKNF